MVQHLIRCMTLVEMESNRVSTTVEMDAHSSQIVKDTNGDQIPYLVMLSWKLAKYTVLYKPVLSAIALQSQMTRLGQLWQRTTMLFRAELAQGPMVVH